VGVSGAGLFSKDAVFDRVEFLFNRTYKRAFGPKSSRVIRLVRPRDSSATDLIQLTDVLLGAFTCSPASDSSRSWPGLCIAGPLGLARKEPPIWASLGEGDLFMSVCK
jgi:hypothetical protein